MNNYLNSIMVRVHGYKSLCPGFKSWVSQNLIIWFFYQKILKGRRNTSCDILKYLANHVGPPVLS